MKKIFNILAAILLGSVSAFAADEPTYPGGDTAMQEYITSTVVYPAMAKENGVEGIVTVGFIVMPDGSLRDLKIVKPVDPDLEKEAIRVVNGMPKWNPAQENGTPVEAPSKVDVPFILDE